MPGTPRIRAMRNRFLVFGQIITAAIVAYSRFDSSSCFLIYFC